MRHEELYLSDIVEAATAIGRFAGGVTRDRFLRDELRQSAVLQKLMVIGEAAARLPRAYREEHPEIIWADIVAFRNIAVMRTSALIGEWFGLQRHWMSQPCA